MKKTSLVVHQNHVEEVIKILHQQGLMQIIDISKEEPETLDGIQKAQMDPETETCALYELRLTRLIDILKKVKPKKKGIKAMLTPELPEIKTIEECSLEELYSYAEGFLDNTEKKILEKEEKLQSLNEEKEKIKADLEKLDYFTGMDFNLEDIGESEYLIVKIGLTKDLDFIKEKLGKIQTAAFFSKQFGTKKKIQWAVLIVAHKRYKDEIEKISKVALTEFSFDVESGDPKDVVKHLKQKTKEINKKRKKLISELRTYAKKQLSDLLALREEIQLEKFRKEISKNFGKTNSSYIIKGWILEKDEETFNDFIKKAAGQYIICDFEKPSEEKDSPPTFLKTPRWAEGFKGLVSMFGTPKYNEINPTIIMGIFFVLFFGVMLGDGGYGLLILILSLFGYFKLGKNSDMFRDWSFMGIWMGVVTTVFGFLTNSFFGNLIQTFIYNDPEAYIYNFELFGMQIKPIVDPIKDPISILVLALVFGLIHLNIGIILGLIQAFKDKEYKEMLTGKLCWIPLQIGGGILILKSILGFSFAEPLIIMSYMLVIIGIAQLFIDSGPIGFFDITGYVGDWLSYARLLALGLATVGMALAFNEVAKLIGNMIPVIGFIITIIVVIFAHLINLGLQALGAGIHSLRLQYVEFFNRFYEGGGTEFSPFKIKRKYTKIKDEKYE